MIKSEMDKKGVSNFKKDAIEIETNEYGITIKNNNTSIVLHEAKLDLNLSAQTAEEVVITLKLPIKKIKLVGFNETQQKDLVIQSYSPDTGLAEYEAQDVTKPITSVVVGIKTLEGERIGIIDKIAYSFDPNTLDKSHIHYTSTDRYLNFNKKEN